MQDYKNHRRFHPLFHFVLVPLALFHLIYQIVRLIQEPGFDRAESVLLAIILVGILFIARMNALKVQDRVIRLEEQVRYHKVLQPDLAFQAENLPLNQILALRFASDAELPTLVSRTLGGDVHKPNEIKQIVINWRPDEMRV
ncbi:MAG: DUF6526 family protein [Pyrinomonadaceae bacterium]